MIRIPGFLKDPLSHFLAAGCVLVSIGAALSPPSPEKDQIVVDRAALLEFIQFRSKAFEPVAAAALLDSMDKQRRAQLVDDYIKEEALYREAQALGLESDDYVIKQRLVQKLFFATEAVVGEPTLGEDEIVAYYESHRDDYAISPSATFTHVFLNAAERGADQALGEAARQVEILNKTGARFEDAVRFGDRFPFHTNYVERTYDYVASQLGDNAAKTIFDPEGPFDVWRGPLVSPYGAHAVYVIAVEPGRIPPLEEIRDRVTEDAARNRKAELVDEIISGIVAGYQVAIDLGEPTE